jgi:hypothetical protein
MTGGTRTVATAACHHEVVLSQDLHELATGWRFDDVFLTVSVGDMNGGHEEMIGD